MTIANEYKLISMMTQFSENFCLKWNDFQQNTVCSISELRNDQEFADVTLACEDGHHIDAHRIILTSCSPFFRSVLKRNNHSHPLIYMRGLKAKELVAIVDFLYLGEANIQQEDLDDFLALAEELQLKGLTGSGSATNGGTEETTKKSNNDELIQLQHPKLKAISNDVGGAETQVDELIQDNNTQNWKANCIVPFDAGLINVPQELAKEDIEAKKMSMIERVEDGISNWRCTMCGKTTKSGSPIIDIKRHTEIHFEGASYPCNRCGKVSRSSNALRRHVSSYHRK